MNFSVSMWNYLCAYKAGADLFTAIDEVARGGFGVELWLDWLPKPDIFDGEEKKVLEERLKGVSTSAHAFFGEANYTAFVKQIDLCASLHIPVLVVHEDTVGLYTDEGIGFCKRVVDYAAKKGVKVALENGSFAILSRAVDSIAELKICIDTGHAHKEGLRVKNPIRAYLEKFKERIVHFHIDDNHGESDEHLIPGKGNINWKDFRKAVSKLDFNGTYVLELRSSDNPLKDAEEAREFLLSLNQD